MTLPASGQMTAAMINVELGRASNAPFSQGGAAERALAQRPTGSVSMNDFYGKSSAAPFSVTATPTSIDESGSSNFITTGAATANVTGGTGPFTYAWSILSQSGAYEVTINTPTGSSTSFQANIPFAGNDAVAVVRCAVTDTSNAQVQNTNEVDVSITRT